MYRRVKARGPPYGQRGRRSSSTVEVEVYSCTVVDHISWAAARAGPCKHVGSPMGRLDVVVVVAIVHTPYLMGRGPDRPMKTRGRLHGQGGAVHIEPIYHGPRPGPAHQISGWWAAARPGPSILQMMGGRARPSTFSKFHGPARPAHHFFKILGPARPGPSHFCKYSAGLGPLAHDKSWY